MSSSVPAASTHTPLVNKRNVLAVPLRKGSPKRRLLVQGNKPSSKQVDTASMASRTGKPNQKYRSCKSTRIVGVKIHKVSNPPPHQRADISRRENSNSNSDSRRWFQEHIWHLHPVSLPENDGAPQTSDIGRLRVRGKLVDNAQQQLKERQLLHSLSEGRGLQKFAF